MDIEYTSRCIKKDTVFSKEEEVTITKIYHFEDEIVKNNQGLYSKFLKQFKLPDKASSKDIYLKYSIDLGKQGKNKEFEKSIQTILKTDDMPSFYQYIDNMNSNVLNSNIERFSIMFKKEYEVFLKKNSLQNNTTSKELFFNVRRENMDRNIFRIIMDKLLVVNYANMDQIAHFCCTCRREKYNQFLYKHNFENGPIAQKAFFEEQAYESGSESSFMRDYEISTLATDLYSLNRSEKYSKLQGRRYAKFLAKENAIDDNYSRAKFFVSEKYNQTLKEDFNKSVELLDIEQKKVEVPTETASTTPFSVGEKEQSPSEITIAHSVEQYDALRIRNDENTSYFELAFGYDVFKEGIPQVVRYLDTHPEYDKIQFFANVMGGVSIEITREDTIETAAQKYLQAYSLNTNKKIEKLENEAKEIDKLAGIGMGKIELKDSFEALEDAKKDLEDQYKENFNVKEETKLEIEEQNIQL